MIGVDRSSRRAPLSSEFPRPRVRFDLEDLQNLLRQVQASENVRQVSGASISGALFGSLQDGVSHVRSLQPFSSVLDEAVPNMLSAPGLKGLRLIGWYCVRQTDQAGLSTEDIDFHCAYFPRRTDIALILSRAKTDGYRAELYARSTAGVFSRDDHRFSSFSLPGDPLLINRSLYLAVQSAIADSSGLRPYEITSTSERQDRWQEWKSRVPAFCKPKWLRARHGGSRSKGPYSILGVADLATKAAPIAFPAKSSLAGEQQPTTTRLSREDENLKARALPSGGVRLLRIISLWLVVVMLAATLAIILLRYRPQAFTAKDEGSLAASMGFEAVRSDPGLELHWNASALALKTAKTGVLTITDGSQVRKLELDRAQLETGRVHYVPETQDVNFRLEVYTQNNRNLSESVRILGNTLAGTSSSKADTAHKIPPKDTLTSPNRNSVSNLHRPSAVKPAEAKPNSSMAQLAVRDAQNQPKEASLVAPPPSKPKPVTPGPPVALSDQSGMPSYIGPQPLQKPTPNVTALSAGIDSIREVGVEVYIDDSGRVTNARIVNANSNANSALEKAAISDALQWTFEPARLHGKAISSTHKILFRFNRSHENARR